MAIILNQIRHELQQSKRNLHHLLISLMSHQIILNQRRHWTTAKYTAFAPGHYQLDQATARLSKETEFIFPIFFRNSSSWKEWSPRSSPCSKVLSGTILIISRLWSTMWTCRRGRKVWNSNRELWSICVNYKDMILRLTLPCWSCTSSTQHTTTWQWWYRSVLIYQ